MRLTGTAWDTGASISKNFNGTMETMTVSGNPATGYLRFGFDPGTGTLAYPMNLTNIGLGLGTTTPSRLLHVTTSTSGATVAQFESGASTCTVIPDTGVSCSSDRRLKENIEEITNGLNAVLKLQGVTFNWTGREGRYVGFIAQDVEKVVPELVRTDEKGFKQVNYANFTPLLVESVKELNRELAAAKEENREIKKALCELGKKIFCL